MPSTAATSTAQTHRPSAQVIDGRAFAAKINQDVAEDVRTLRQRWRVQPCLAVIMAGNDPASSAYVRKKARQSVAAGMKSIDRRLPHDVKESELLLIIEGLNDDPTVHGILVQLPLPKHINCCRILGAIRPEKDVDGFHPINVGLLATRGDGVVPCTPLGCSLLLDAFVGDIAGLNALVIGCSTIVGRPMAQMLLRAGCTVAIAHRLTRDLASLCRWADILVAAAGSPGLVKGDWIKPGATVLDVGINRVPSTAPGRTHRLVGDVDSSAMMVADLISPVPGGVGPVTVACLLRNTVDACKQINNIKAL